jgi:hypothetical protein
VVSLGRVLERADVGFALVERGSGEVLWAVVRPVQQAVSACATCGAVAAGATTTATQVLNRVNRRMTSG